MEEQKHEKLTLEKLSEAVSGKAAAFRCTTEYQPAGGPGDKVFPPTYEGGKYATETRLIDGEQVPCVLIDSVQSQANRMELALLEAVREGRIELPIIESRFEDPSLLKPFVVTSLEAPHRWPTPFSATAPSRKKADRSCSASRKRAESWTTPIFAMQAVFSESARPLLCSGYGIRPVPGADWGRRCKGRWCLKW